ncbi:hypothetical protein QKU48_gp0010 [Fadolivirus algeromassiliense]|jgi:hypothetical protein|uniref:Uncharacterized protein n=1 Tax=Fadolivirus FV1/VV64 TaxID=3070911 RepID=A0A7D3UNN3_9VIRU|nr:hypothetical protein QKU48_gp0010 [Fadolivirus algeromassiliense]QKF93468.1 hypothetical protein Fadolivirus_1_10 [Fadolivirus FV1/VV64]
MSYIGTSIGLAFKGILEMCIEINKSCESYGCTFLVFSGVPLLSIIIIGLTTYIMYRLKLL